MIEIKIEKSTCDHGATIFTATPAEISLGGLDASQVDEIHVTPTEDWAGCTIRLTIVPHFAPRIARILDDSGIVKVTSDMTIKKSGVIVIDAQNADGYAAYSTDIRYTAYDHQRAGTASGQPSPSEYQQMIAMAAEGIKSVNGVLPDENGNITIEAIEGGGYDVEQLVRHTITEDEAASAVYVVFDLPKNYHEYIVLYYATPALQSINGSIGFVDGDYSAWSNISSKITGNVKSFTSGYVNGTFRIAVSEDSLLIPIAGYQAANTLMQSDSGSRNPDFMGISMTTTANAAPIQRSVFKNRKKISIGSYQTGFFGAGSIFAVYGIGGYDFVEEGA